MIGNDTLMDIFSPPAFGVVGSKPLKQAVIDGNWLGSINVWVVRKAKNSHDVLYQKRPDDSYFAPGKFDVSVAGYYEAGDRQNNPFREFQEELGVPIDRQKTWKITRRLYALVNENTGRERRIVIDVVLSQLDKNLDELNPDKSEVNGLVWVPIENLVDVLLGHAEKISLSGINGSRESTDYELTKDSFPPNFDNYHLFMARLIKAWSDGALEFDLFGN